MTLDIIIFRTHHPKFSYISVIIIIISFCYHFEFILSISYNLFQLLFLTAMSAGGFGHVPLPLIKGELRYRPPPEQYKRSFLFYGDPTFATRQKSLANLKSSLEFHNITHLFGRGESIRLLYMLPHFYTSILLFFLFFRF